MGLCKTSIFSIFTLIRDNDLKFCTRSYSSCVYHILYTDPIAKLLTRVHSENEGITFYTGCTFVTEQLNLVKHDGELFLSSSQTYVDGTRVRA